MTAAHGRIKLIEFLGEEEKGGRRVVVVGWGCSAHVCCHGDPGAVTML